MKWQAVVMMIRDGVRFSALRRQRWLRGVAAALP